MKKTPILAIAMATALLFGACKQNTEPAEAQPQTADKQATADNIYQFDVNDGEGQTVHMKAYEGDVLLVVNTATHCGFTPQYEELQDLYERYAAKGFKVIDFPCNQFGEQAPGTDEEIHAFCTGNYDITFPQMSKIDVNGDQADPLFVWLKSKAPFGGFDLNDPRGAYLDQMFRSQDPDYDKNPDIKWNFTKFLIDREGNVVRRFEPTDPATAIEEALKALL